MNIIEILKRIILKIDSGVDLRQPVRKDFDYFEKCGLNIKYLGSWFEWDYKKDFQCNMIARCVKLTQVIESSIGEIKSGKHSRIDEKILLEWLHLGAVMHNATAYMWHDVGLKQEYVDASQININYVRKKYGAVLE